MKRFFYNVKQFTPESEGELAAEQYTNDAEFIHTVFHEYKLHPIYSEKERFEDGMNYTGHLDYQLYSWEGDKLKWLDHTSSLFNREYENLKGYEKEFTKEDLNELEYAIKWLNDKREEYLNNQKSINALPNKNKLEKIKWLGRPSHLAHIFMELSRKGFIEMPKAKGSYSPYRYAELCYEIFEIKGKLSSLKKEFEKSSLKDCNKDAFKIPYKKDLS